MKYCIDITNTYARVIVGQDLVALNTYLHFDEETVLEGESIINFENLVINMDGEQEYSAIIQKNINSVLKQYSDSSIVAKKAQLKISGIKCGMISVIHEKNKYFHGTNAIIEKDDKVIHLEGWSYYSSDCYFDLSIVFKGKIELFFSEEDILLYVDKYNVLFSKKDYEQLNFEQTLKINKIGNDELNKIVGKFNQLIPRFYHNDFYEEYFNNSEDYGYCFAVKSECPVQTSNDENER